ncbi:MAG: SpoIVB peptidase S55 domain-containing protein [Planctomycetota bacterium]
MKRRISIFITLWLFILIGHGIGNTSLESSVPIMKADDIKIGMTGYGKTVFQGTKIEKFDIEVLGVLKNGSGPKYDMILIKCHHPVIDKAGIIAGMSGSPIYIVTDKEKEPEGILIGALAYGWQFCNDALAGVTPIEMMLSDLNKPLEKTAGYFKNDAEEKMVREKNSPNNIGVMEMKPLMTPLFVTGVSSYRMRSIAKALEKYNLVPVQSGAASNELKELVSKELEPGSPVGVTLVRGDENWTGIGTVTYRDGDKILAFGHSMSDYGEEVIAPLTNAYIYGTMSSLRSSFKFGSAVNEVGCLQQDRRSSVSGILKKTAKMMPMKIIVENIKTGRKETFNYEVLHHRNVLPDMLPNLMMSAADAVEVMPFEPALIEVTTHLKIKDCEPVTFKRLVSDTASGAGCSAINNIFNPIWNNPYMKIEVEDVSFELRIINENRGLELINVWTEVKDALPGETVTIYCQLKPYLKEPFIKTIDFTIPKDMKPGQNVDITVMGSNNIMPPLPSPTNVAELINYLKSFYDGGNLIAIMTLPNIDLRIKGDNYKSLPKSFLSAFINQWQGPVYGSSGYDTYRRRPTLEKPLELGQDYLLSVEPMQHIVYGSDRVSLNIVKYKNR